VEIVIEDAGKAMAGSFRWAQFWTLRANSGTDSTGTTRLLAGSNLPIRRKPSESQQVPDSTTTV
jgi:hypothetical protein